LEFKDSILKAILVVIADLGWKFFRLGLPEMMHQGLFFLALWVAHATPV
jgi:hypothetical protein